MRRGRRVDGFPELSGDTQADVVSLSVLQSRSDNQGFQGGAFRLRFFSIELYRARCPPQNL